MSGDESGTETYEESDYSSASDNDMPGEAGSSPERNHTKRVPRLALGGTSLLQASRPQRTAVPRLGLGSSAATEELPAVQQSTSHQTSDAVPQEADQAPAGNISDAASTAPAQPSDAADRHCSEPSMSRANSQRKSSRQLTAPQFTIQLASEAFDIHSDALGQPDLCHLPQFEAAKQICAAKMGLKAQALTFYELREVHSLAECSGSTTQLAVAVQGSSKNFGRWQQNMLDDIALTDIDGNLLQLSL